MRGVQKVPVADTEVHERVLIIERILRVSTKYVIDRPSIMLAHWDLAVAVIVFFTTWPSQPLYLEPLGRVDETKVRVGVAASGFVFEPAFFESVLAPILKVKLLVPARCTFDQDT